MPEHAIVGDGAITLTHCPGRARIRVAGLYRSESEKSRLEKELARQEHVIAVYANELTGNLLLLFDPSIPPEKMLAAIGMRPPTNEAGAIRQRAPGRRIAGRVDRQAPYPAWHAREVADALAGHGSDMRLGLSGGTATHRLRQGDNRLPQIAARSGWDILLSQFKSFPVLLLGASAGLALATGGLSEALAIAAVLVLNAGIGYGTEKKAEVTIASLAELIDDEVPVLRDGKVQDLPASHIVPGDVLVLAPGVRVAADARVLQAQGLNVDESALTGESRPSPKISEALPRQLPLSERRNMVYMGTGVSTGSGMAVVVGTGANTELGAIQSLLEHTERPRTPLQQQLDQLGNRLVEVSVGICGGIFLIGLLRGQSLLQMFKAAVSLAIAAVPEGLPTVATTSLARGLRTMRAKQMLIRRLHAVETLGAIHTICLDKTGTLTMNRMAVVAVQSGGVRYELPQDELPWRHETATELTRFVQVCVLCNEIGARNGASSFDSSNGSATENALVKLAADAGADVAAMRAGYPLLHAELRAEGKNYMKTLHAAPDAKRRFVAVKGSPLEVLQLCRYRQKDDKVLELSNEDRAEIEKQNRAMAARRLRVLGFAYADLPAAHDGTHSEHLVWLGLAGLEDPLRPGVENIIAELHRAGIRTVMVTGDQNSTAYAIGKSLKLNNGGPLDIVDAERLDQLPHEEFERLVPQADIFSRVSPARKLQIVQALRASGEVVAMTGDGINDGPALRAANVGIAMGLHGTDLARSAADVVLKDDRLETILEAVRQGRTITGNIEKSLHFLISSNLSEILLVLGSVSVAGTNGLTPMQLLWINLLTDVLPAIALAAEPTETDEMQRPPRNAKDSLIGNRRLKHYASEASLIAGGALTAHFYGLARYGSGARANALAFNSLLLGQLLHALSCRSDSHGVFAERKSEANRGLQLAIGGSIGLQLLANVLPWLRKLLGTGGMSLADIGVAAAGAVIPTMLIDAKKIRAARPAA